MLSFSEALANELKGTGVTVSALCPGPTKTEFDKKADLGKSKLFDSGLMSAKDVANTAYKGLMAEKTVIIPGVKNYLLANSVRLMPRKVVTNVVRQIQAEK